MPQKSIQDHQNPPPSPKSLKFTRPHTSRAKLRRAGQLTEQLAAQIATHISLSPPLPPLQHPRLPPNDQAPKAPEPPTAPTETSAQAVGGPLFQEIPLFKVGQRSPESKDVYLTPPKAACGAIVSQKPVREDEMAYESADEGVPYPN